MATILRTLGLGFRVVGSLDLSNAVLNPKFALFSGGAFNNWTTFGRATPTNATDHVAFGTQACKLTIASGASATSGITQTNIPVIGGETYNISASFFIGSTLPTFIDAAIYTTDLNANNSATTTVHMVTGTATPAFARASFPFTAPDLGVTATLSFQITTASAVNFYVDGVRLVAGATEDDYIDGDYSGYVWADQPDASATLQSTPPDALHFFATGGPVSPQPVVT